MSHLQQVFRYLCRAVAARVYDPSELQEGKISKAVQVGSPTLMVIYLKEYFRSQLRRDLSSMPTNDIHLWTSIVRDLLQAPQSSLATEMVLCQHDEDCLLLCPLLELIREAASSEDEAYCQFVLHT